MKRKLGAVALLSLTLTSACSSRAWAPAASPASALDVASYECERDNRLAGFKGNNTRFYRDCMKAHGWQPAP